MKTRNSGFSLIELIIAISILMILSGLVFLGINTAKRKSTDKSARELCNQIQLLHTVSMAQAGEWRLCLYEKDREYYCIQERLTEVSNGFAWEAASEKTKLGHKGTVFYEMTQDMDHYAGKSGSQGDGGQESGSQGGESWESGSQEGESWESGSQEGESWVSGSQEGESWVSSSQKGKAQGNGGQDGSGLVHSWKFDRDTGACIKGAGILEVSGSGRTMEVAVYPENGRCEARAKGQ